MCLWESKKAFRKALAVSVSETPASFSSILAKCVICYLCSLVTALANRHSHHGHASPFWSALPMASPATHRPLRLLCSHESHSSDQGFPIMGNVSGSMPDSCSSKAGRMT